MAKATYVLQETDSAIHPSYSRVVMCLLVSQFLFPFTCSSQFCAVEINANMTCFIGIQDDVLRWHAQDNNYYLFHYVYENDFESPQTLGFSPWEQLYFRLKIFQCCCYAVYRQIVVTHRQAYSFYSSASLRTHISLFSFPNRCNRTVCQSGYTPGPSHESCC